MNHPDNFPVLQGKLIKAVPWAMLLPHEVQALRNHDQTLVRLAERGGLSAAEALDVLDDKHWRSDGRMFRLPSEREACDAYNAERETELIRRVEQWKTGG